MGFHPGTWEGAFCCPPSCPGSDRVSVCVSVHAPLHLLGEKVRADELVGSRRLGWPIRLGLVQAGSGPVGSPGPLVLLK